ncbi:hypothetical protein [Micromonospora sp. Llam0]|uniref:hypothetical protein n=1 Tax=Micromonospora sp. Llam0 TaxID=2485143 RepID=UPI000F4AF0D2|nr:hypothetical protein [Micromonospora sp. Llam0]
MGEPSRRALARHRYPYHTDTDIPPRLRRVFASLRAGRRDVDGSGRRISVDPAEWLVAVVDAHH